MPLSYSFDQDGQLTLLKNPYAWSWREGKSKITKVRFSDQISKKLDVIRISSFKDFQEVKNYGLHVVYSLPNVTWFAGFQCQNEKECADKREILAGLQAKHQNKKDKTNITPFDLHADFFFPPSVNCVGKKRKSQQDRGAKGCVSFKYGTKRENPSVINYLTKLAKEAGHRVNDKSCKKTHEFLVAAQFTNEEIIPTLDFFATRENMVHGIGKLKDVINVTADNESCMEKLCDELSRFPFMPVAFGRSAMFYKEKHLRPVFFKSGGNFNIGDIPFLEEGKE